MTFHWVAAGDTDRGRVRPSNEDSFTVLSPEGIYLVADGMGGHAAGEVASQIAVDEIVAALRDAESDGTRTAQVAEALRRANARILAEADREPGQHGMGTTATVLSVDPGSNRFIIGHVGDSRAYLLRGHSLRLLTRDHTWVQLQVDAGKLTAEEARHHPYSSVLVQALGTDESVSPDVLEGRAEPGDLYVLCSDGLTTTMSDAELEAVLEQLKGAAPNVLVAELIREANDRGAPDNVTVVALRALGEGAEDSASGSVAA